ncbi:MAG: signaling recognition particle receptor family protein [candidate division NC10 bacterium]|nr:signaling recognition particle receptor family protein [candidate division NC10 bacterium]
MPSEAPPARSGFFSRLRDGLRKTRESLVEKIETVLTGATIDEATLDELEEALLASDLGPAAAKAVMDSARTAFRREGATTVLAMRALLASRIAEILVVSVPDPPRPTAPPFVMLFVGTNGSGKTTTIAKLAKRYRDAGESVLLAAGDTFRAAAIGQLQIWGKRVGADVIAHQPGADPSAVVFDACKAAAARNRVIGRAIPGAPHETFLVLDATTGLNAVSQAREFHQAVALTGIVVTKPDGTAKGGAVVGIARALQVHVRYVGVGESSEDLQPFNPQEFAAALFS